MQKTVAIGHVDDAWICLCRVRHSKGRRAFLSGYDMSESHEWLLGRVLKVKLYC